MNFVKHALSETLCRVFVAKALLHPAYDYDSLPSAYLRRLSDSFLVTVTKRVTGFAKNARS